MFLYFNQYFKTAQTSLRGKTNGGVAYLLPEMILKVVYLVPLMFLWRVLIKKGVDAGMGLPQLLSYTYINALLTDMLVVKTYMSEWDFDCNCATLFTRPAPVFGQVIARTVGEWVPSLLFFSLPMTIAAPFCGIQILPKTVWFLPSLLLCVSLGFAFEFFFVCITIRLRNITWLTQVFRTAIVSFFSGTVIPFKILPFGLDKWIGYQPFGSLGGAPLSLFVGTGEPEKVIPLQIFWNIVIWWIAAVWFRKSKERMVSFGG